MHHRQNERSKSAPTGKLSLRVSLQDISSRRYEEDHLCAWGDPAGNSTPSLRLNETAHSNVNINNTATAVKKSNSCTKTRLKPSTKRLNKLMRNSSRDKMDDYVFKHFTDCGRYMVDYREDKLKKIRDSLGDEYPLTVSPSPSGNVDLTLDNSVDRRYALTLQAPKDNEALGLVYRVNGDKSKKSLKIPASTNLKELYGVPMRVSGDKCLQCHQENNKTTHLGRVPLKSNICSLPKCEPFYVPTKTPPSKHTDKSSLHPDQFLQGKKFSELSLNNCLESRSFAQRAWRPQPIKTREKVRSAQERKRNENTSPSSLHNNYTNIIKRVLEHYDPSNNTVRNSLSKNSGELKNAFVLAST